jgi:hypothetical protein
MHCHYVGSIFWDQLPYHIFPTVWQRYYIHLYEYVARHEEHQAFLHGRVLMPVEPTVAYRSVIYRLFIYNTPFAFFDQVHALRFRLVFERVEGQEDITILFMRLTPTTESPALYPEDDHPVWV